MIITGSISGVISQNKKDEKDREERKRKQEERIEPRGTVYTIKSRSDLENLLKIVS